MKILLEAGSAEIIEKNFPKPKIYAKTIKPNGISRMALPLASGTKSDAKAIEEKLIIGINLKTQEVVLLYTVSFFINLTKSHNGCKILTPFLPAQKALVFFNIPNKIKGATNKINIFKIVINIIFSYPNIIKPIIASTKKISPNKIYCCILPLCILSNFAKNFSSSLIIGSTM